MAEKIPTPVAGDSCPNCGDAFIEHRAPTDAERAAADNLELRTPLPARVDTASAAQRAQLGPLVECRGCGYRSRLTPTDGDEPQKASRPRKARDTAAAGSSHE
jgi:hypothetical protein